MTPSRTINRFSPLPSETVPSWLSSIASSYPAKTASVLARMLVVYRPESLTPVGIEESIGRRHDEVWHFSGRLLSIYEPNGTTTSMKSSSTSCSLRLATSWALLNASGLM